MLTQPSWWKHTFLCHKYRNAHKIFDSQVIREQLDLDTKSKPIGCTTDYDMKVIAQLLRYQNAPLQLMIMALPTISTLAFCPLTLFMYDPMIKFFWPEDNMPNINDAIASFLTPAGLVYAISFGFAFQEAQNKQNSVSLMFKTLEHTMKQILLLVSVSSMSLEQKQKLKYFLKQETVTMMAMIVNKDHQKDEIWLTRDSKIYSLFVLSI